MSPCGNDDIDCIDCCGREVCELSEFYLGELSEEVLEGMKIMLKEKLGIDVDEVRENWNR